MRGTFEIAGMVFASLPPVVGNAHLLLLHLPVGIVVAAILLEWWTWRDAQGGLLVAKLLAVNAGFAVAAAAAGLVLAGRGAYAEGPLALHRWTGVICAVTACLAWWLRARRGVAAGRIGLGLLAVATGVAGHFGATLTHGDGLMAWSARSRSGLVSGGRTTDTAAGNESSFEVHPLLLTHCVECHGPEKQKGRLRLDTLAAARGAGKSGEIALVPGDPEKSELMRRILLPRDDEEAMPPGDLTPLSAAEMSALETWVKALRAE